MKKHCREYHNNYWVLCLKIRQICSISVFSRFGHLSLSCAQAKLAICTLCPFIFRRPICGTHGTVLGHSPSPGSSPLSARARDEKTLQYCLHWEVFHFSFSLFSPFLVHKQSLKSSCTHLTPVHRTRHNLPWGNKQGLVLQRNFTPQWSLPPSRLFLSHLPPHPVFCTPLSCPLLCFVFFNICQSLGLFALLLLKSTVLSRAHTKGWNLFYTVLHTLVIELSLIFSLLSSELISKILCRLFKEIILWHMKHNLPRGKPNQVTGIITS